MAIAPSTNFHRDKRRLGACAIVLLALAAPSLAMASTVRLTVRYPAGGPVLSLSSDPDLAFRCRTLGSIRVCQASAAKGAVVTLRARTVPDPNAGSASAAALPMADAAWAGACRETHGDVCRLTMTRARTVLIRPDAP